MEMGWKVVYIEDCEYLSTVLDNLKIQKKDQEVLLPLKDINTLILDNNRLVVSLQLINRCAENNINLVFCGIDHNPSALLIPHSGHHLMAAVLKDQISWSDHHKKLVHQLIIKEKIRNQYHALGVCGTDSSVQASLLLNYINEVEPGDPNNREGLAAKVYFRLMFGDDFQRFNDDAINTGLNYGYTILRSQINRIIVSKGLNSSLGIIHKGPMNAFNLSDDIIEIFRPIVDVWVYEHLRLAIELTRENRISLVQLTTIDIVFDQQKQTLFNAMVLYVESIMNFFKCGLEIKFPDFGDFHGL